MYRVTKLISKSLALICKFVITAFGNHCNLKLVYIEFLLLIAMKKCFVYAMRDLLCNMFSQF